MENKQISKHLIEIGSDYKGIKLDKFLIDEFSVTFSLIRKMCRKGQVRINSSRAKGNETLRTGDVIKVPNAFLDNKENNADNSVEKKNYFSDKDVAKAKELILFEDDDILVINKPAGIPVQAGSKQDRSIDRLFTQVYPAKPPRLVHRLDKDTSGCLVLAKNKSVAKILADQFANRTTEKTYLTIAVGNLIDPKGVIDFSVAKVFTTHNKERMKVVDDLGKDAFTSYERIDRSKNYHLLKVNIKTGRTHQIRVHLESIGVPVLGDTKYSDRDTNKLKNGKFAKMCLHSYNLELEHPVTGKTLSLTAPISDRMLETMDYLNLRMK
ncbi:MAG: RluA family pseudouridine synthase [Proteobacteria bacterium]|nr:RluA family pseudouridine synthase [Pseudomonadota bacterium]